MKITNLWMDAVKIKPMGKTRPGFLLCRRWDGKRKFKCGKKQGQEVGKWMVQCARDVIIVTSQLPT